MNLFMLLHREKTKGKERKEYDVGKRNRKEEEKLNIQKEKIIQEEENFDVEKKERKQRNCREKKKR